MSAALAIIENMLAENDRQPEPHWISKLRNAAARAVLQEAHDRIAASEPVTRQQEIYRLLRESELRGSAVEEQSMRGRLIFELQQINLTIEPSDGKVPV